MLKIESSNIQRSNEFALTTDTLKLEEGAFLVADYSEGSLMKVKPATGEADEIFVGNALSCITDISVIPNVEEILVLDPEETGESITVVLESLPLPDSMMVIDLATGEEAAVAPALEGNVLTFVTGAVGSTFQVAYERQATVAEARALQGDIAPGQQVTSVLSRTGVVQAGTVYTSNWDTSVVWTGDAKVTLAANGMITVDGDGTEIPCLIVELPTASSPYMGISYNV